MEPVNNVDSNETDKIAKRSRAFFRLSHHQQAGGKSTTALQEEEEQKKVDSDGRLNHHGGGLSIYGCNFR